MKRKNYCHEWKKILKLKSTIFVDEKPFELGASPNKQNTRFYRHQLQKNTVPVVETVKQPTKIHTFCCINWNGQSEVRIYVKRVQKKRGDGF